MAARQHPRRREEILRAAARRFARQGFLATSVAEIIDDAGIAKGTFYHHFASKDELMRAIIELRVAELVDRAEELAAEPGLAPLEQLLAILGSNAGGEPDELVAELERDGNELMHLRALDATIEVFTPVVARVLAAGRETGAFRLEDPEATAAAFLVVSAQLVDRDLLGWRREGRLEHLHGLIAAAERLLGAEPGALAPLRGALDAGRPAAEQER